MIYKVNVSGIAPNTCKSVVWDCGDERDPGYITPSLGEIVQAAQKEFPGIPLEQLETHDRGYEGNWSVVLEERI